LPPNNSKKRKLLELKNSVYKRNRLKHSQNQNDSKKKKTSEHRQDWRRQKKL
jgi:hypothetical protein